MIYNKKEKMKMKMNSFLDAYRSIISEEYSFNNTFYGQFLSKFIDNYGSFLVKKEKSSEIADIEIDVYFKERYINDSARTKGKVYLAEAFPYFDKEDSQYKLAARFEIRVDGKWEEYDGSEDYFLGEDCFFNCSLDCKNVFSLTKTSFLELLDSAPAILRKEYEGEGGDQSIGYKFKIIDVRFENTWSDAKKHIVRAGIKALKDYCKFGTSECKFTVDTSFKEAAALNSVDSTDGSSDDDNSRSFNISSLKSYRVSSADALSMLNGLSGLEGIGADLVNGLKNLGLTGTGDISNAEFENKNVTPEDLWNTANNLVNALDKIKEMAKKVEIDKPWPWEK